MAELKILIVEDEFVVANDLDQMLTKNGYFVTGIATSVLEARHLISLKKPDWVLLDIILREELTGVDLAFELREMGVPFLFISANTNQSILELVKKTNPYGFMVKPFRERDLLIMLDIARYKFNLEQGIISESPVEYSTTNFQIIDGIVGQSNALKAVFKKINLVAPSSTSVLIIGESGTGKEALAQAIHRFSQREIKPFITLNCAALPESLIESELFGHERGAFTGATNRRIGKFEQANGGTIFLDEVGELPIDSQVKLLRVLQEREIERVGGEDCIKVDVRVVAATNRNLEKEVAEGRFRLDLYYRLNVFPIHLPPLRERLEDIEDLVHYFIHKFTKQSKHGKVSISAFAMDQLKTYSWPGNVRQLEHLIERSVLLASNHQIESIEIPSVRLNTTLINESLTTKTLEQVEREHIINVLRECRGRVSGKGGAAETLDMPATTLYLKMKKLDIKQTYYY
ncbi:sigma-54-dependent transcriptional regulator [Dyadobacter subterraneus]|uniref:Sigma-54-dependent Fis family transcriptional regulator n=1 Tax=Dyadobacter subterraneus TaxID=2773304 RepID=A0ABR9W750_9BACT|nr:sigma-54 dependent transcriptional regulator [Dyadobacter subterraneus]MBE9461295.1 sigma-54-dependent Fis family transcriptional regulator [Dyadobacter subterraneus]